ncbi:uncharacterized protein FTOL_01500 [Fusarium torulosum]|uniref:Uncharacterized protein n=1 Tax=Fusarium torulosum TaxID=33205 RepID=A0AAE8M047_9HYPO|nr:uncharacterized protein FTOL_01500 [Fusarium torulosum]
MAGLREVVKSVIQIWDPATGVRIKDIEIDTFIGALAYSGGGLRLAVSTWVGVKVLDTKRYDLVHEFSWDTVFSISALYLSSNGALLAFHDQAKLCIRNLDQHEYLYDPQAFSKVGISDDEGPILFSGDNQYIALRQWNCVYVCSFTGVNHYDSNSIG